MESSPLFLRPFSGLFYQPWLIGLVRVELVNGMGNKSARWETAPVPLYKPQTTNSLSRDQTRAAEVANQEITARATVRHQATLPVITIGVKIWKPSVLRRISSCDNQRASTSAFHVNLVGSNGHSFTEICVVFKRNWKSTRLRRRK